MPRMRLIIVLAVVVGAFMALAPSANASLGRFINEGLSSNKKTATNRVKQLVEVNPKAAAAIAADMGVSSSSVDWSTLQATSQGTCKGYNTGQGSGGSVHTTTYGTYACWRFKVDIKGSVTKRFNMKHNCSNPLLHRHRAPQPRSKVVKKTITLKRVKSFKMTVSHVCPSGQTVDIAVSGTVRITVRARSWTRIWGAYSQKLSAAVSASIAGKIEVSCGSAPPPPPSGGNCSNVVTGNGNNVGGNCNVGVCSNINSPGGVVNCNGEEGLAPQITCVMPAHVFQGGNVQIYCEASDPDGDALAVNILSETSTGHTSGVIPVGVRWDGSACPTNVSCYRATFWGDSVGNATVLATVSAGGQTASFRGSFPVLNGNGGFGG